MPTKIVTHTKQAGLTLIEMLVVAPLVILLIGTSLGYISSLTGQGLQTRQKTSQAYTVQASLDDMEVNANRAAAFLQTTGTVASPQGKNNDTAQFDASEGSNTLIIKSAATTKSIYDPTRALIYQGTGNSCNENNALYTYLTVYFVKNGELFKRTILPNTAACAAPYQQNSCATAVMNNPTCKVEDEKLADNVTAFSVNYLSSNATSSIANADTVSITLTMSQLSAGQTISYTGTIRTTTTNPQADTGQVTGTPQATGGISQASGSNPDIFTCSWERSGNATGYNVRYRYTANGVSGAWIDGPQNTNANSYDIDINANRNKTITCEVTAVTTSGSIPYDPISYDIPLWTNCLLENGWVNYGNTHASAQFYKSPSSIVTIKGLVKSGATANGTRICQLPEGYRPDSRLIFQVAENGGTAGRIDIQADGSVTVVSADAGWTNLSTISFPTAGANWTALTGSNGWVNYGSPYSNVKVIKDSNGKAYLQGLAKSGTATSGTLGYNLPSGYTSASNLFPTQAGGNTTSAIGIQGSSINAREGANSYWSLQASFNTVADTTWTPPTLQNNWVNYGGSWANAGFTKSPEGIVALQGLIKSGTTTSGTVVTNLPSGYRPAEIIICDVVTNSNTYSRLDIYPNGNVITNGNATTGYLSLAGCEFMADGN